MYSVHFTVRVQALIPEVPMVDLNFKEKCPNCRGFLGGWIVKDRFSCPSCSTLLESNQRHATKVSLTVAVVLYLAFAAALNVFNLGTGTKGVLFASGSILPMLVSYVTFKRILKIKVQRNVTAL